MSNQVDRGNRLLPNVASWLRRTFAWSSPNQQLASIVGSLVLFICGNLVSTIYWDVFSVLFSGSPWLGRTIPWVIAVILGISTDMIVKKLLDHVRPRGKYWPDREDE